MASRPTVNLRELSDILGLSQTTVSRALNGYPEVSEATRAKVMAAAARHNYSPNQRARGLAIGQAQAIGHVIPISSQHEMVNPIFADFIAGAGETYAARGYQMVLSMVGDDDEKTVYHNLKARGAVDGVILHAPRTSDGRLDFLDEIGLPYAVHGRVTRHERPYTWLDVNNRRAFQRATEFLIDLGHDRIALVNGIEEMDFARRRREGFLAALTARGLGADPDLMFSEEMTEEFGYRAARTCLARSAPATAFVVSSLLSALGVRRAIEEAGLRFGRDVSVVTHDDALSYLANGGAVPIFTATRSSVRAAGRQLAGLLLDLIEDPGRPRTQVLLEAELMVGQSTGPAPHLQES